MGLPMSRQVVYSASRWVGFAVRRTRMVPTWYIGSGEAASYRRLPPSEPQGPFMARTPARPDGAVFGTARMMRAVLLSGQVGLARVDDLGVGEHVHQRGLARSRRRAPAPAAARPGSTPARRGRPGRAPPRRSGSRAAARPPPSSRRGTPSGASPAPRSRCCPSRRPRARRAARRCRTRGRRSRRRRRPAAGRPGVRGGPASRRARSPARRPGSRTGPGSIQQPGS